MRIPDNVDRTDPEALVAWLESDAFDPNSDEWLDATPLRRIAAADEAVARARQHLADEAAAARDAGMSWSMIGAVLGVSKQAARQRFGAPAHA